MNNERRREIRHVIKKIDAIKSDIDSILSEEQWAFDNMPEGLQNSERGQNCEDSIDLLQEAMEILNDAVNSLESIN